MKSKYWFFLLAAVLLVCIGVSAWLFFPKGTAQKAEIWSDGMLIKTVFLQEDSEFSVESEYGTNVVTVKAGKLAVTQASCPDHYCMHRGFCSGSGEQIVCLPNRLVIKFVGENEIDGVAG